jgi:hypothetical protein
MTVSPENILHMVLFLENKHAGGFLLWGCKGRWREHNQEKAN